MPAGELVGTSDTLSAVLVKAVKPFYMYWTNLDWLIVGAGLIALGLLVGIEVKERFRIKENNNWVVGWQM